MDHRDEQNQTTVQVDAPPPVIAPRSLVAGRPRYIFSGIAAIAALLMLVLLVRSLAAYHMAPLGVVAKATHTPTSAPPATAAVQTAIYSQYNLMSLAMVSANDVWAVGSDYNRSDQSSHVSVFLHFDGVTWKRVPTTFDYPMTSIFMLPSGEGWAAGGNAILHYTAGRWVVDTLDQSEQYEILNAITMVSSDEGWAVGAAGDGQNIPHALILHYLHGRWTRTHVSEDVSHVTLRAISMLARDDGWIVGSDYDAGETGVALHYSGGEWKRVDVGVPGPLYGISALSPDDVWAVGASNPGTGPGFILHYSHGAWQTVPSPTPNILHAVTMRSPAEGWIGGDGAAILHYDGVRWTQVSPTIHGVGLLSVSVMGAEGWATGWAGGTSVLLRYHNGVWTPYVFPTAKA
ncbi:MAG: WD40/YVTN/BNR-like repeat-containing protein [Ktedonobacterales bacterium]